MAKIVIIVLLALSSTEFDAFSKSSDQLDEAIEASKRGNEERAIELYTEALGIGNLSRSDLATAFHGRGYSYYQRGRYDLAIKDLTESLKLVQDSDAYYIRGYSFYQIGQYEEAIKDLNQSIRLKPDIDAYIVLGMSHSAKGQCGIAIDYYLKAISVQPNSAQAYYSRAFCYSQQGLYDKAIEDMDHSMQLDPKDEAKYVFSRGWIKFLKGSLAGAERDFLQVLKATEIGNLSWAMPSIIWLYLVETHQKQDAADTLSNRTRKSNLAFWPGPIVSLFLGKITPQELIVKYGTGKAREEKARQVEVYFYIGQYYLISGDQTQAVKMLKAAVGTGQTTQLEYFAAKQELRRMGLTK